MTSAARAVIVIIKRYGERGQPCRMPACCLNRLEALPSVVTKKVAFLNILANMVRNCGGTWKRLSASKMALGVRRSKALDQSRSMTDSGVWPCSPWSMMRLKR